MAFSLCNQVKRIQFSGSSREQHYLFYLLLTLSDLCNENRADGHCWPSIGVIIKKMRCSRRTVFKYLKILEDEGWLRREHRKHSNGRQTSNDYFLNLEMIKNRATIVICHDDPVQTQDLITLNEMNEILNGQPVHNDEDISTPDVENYPDKVRTAHPSKGNLNSNILNHNLKGNFSVDKTSRGEQETKIRSEHMMAMREAVKNAEILKRMRH